MILFCSHAIDFSPCVLFLVDTRKFTINICFSRVQFEDVHRLNDGQVKHSPEFFYAGSLWKVSIQAVTLLSITEVSDSGFHLFLNNLWTLFCLLYRLVLRLLMMKTLKDAEL